MRDRRSKGLKKKSNPKIRSCIKCNKANIYVKALNMCRSCYDAERRRKQGIKPRPKPIRACVKCSIVGKIHGYDMCFKCYRKIILPTISRPCIKCHAVSKIRAYDMCNMCHVREKRLEKGCKVLTHYKREKGMIGRSKAKCVLCHKFGIMHGRRMCKKCYDHEFKANNREKVKDYKQKPEYREKQRLYSQRRNSRPEIKLENKLHKQSPKGRATTERYNR